jgi:Sulfotransferase family
VRGAASQLRLRRTLAQVERFCFFIGYARSGSTLVGSLLNAHPEVVIAHELDALGQVERGLDRAEVFTLLLRQEQRFAELGYQWTGYDYRVPGLSQGTFSRLRVIGDKRAGKSTHRLGERPDLLDLVRRCVGVPVRVVHVVRNPFDNVATMARHGEGAPGALAPFIENYRLLSTQVDEVRARLEPDELFDLRYEDFAGAPERHLAELCAFLGVSAPQEYVEGCASLVKGNASRTRDQRSWSPAERHQIELLIDARPVLAGYRFEL